MSKNSDLDYIARHDQDPGVRIAAVNRMTSYPNLEYIARHDSNAQVRIAAINRLGHTRN